MVGAEHFGVYFCVPEIFTQLVGDDEIVDPPPHVLRPRREAVGPPAVDILEVGVKVAE